MIHTVATSRRTLVLLAKQRRRPLVQDKTTNSSLYYSTTPRRCAAKDLPPPLPPKTATPSLKSPAAAKKEYLDARKRAGITEDFLKDPQANLLRLQKEMDETKRKLLTAHDKPMWKRLADRFRTKRHSIINLLCASMAYILAHRLHLKMKANKELEDRVAAEAQKTSELRALLRSIATPEFAALVVDEAMETSGEEPNETSSSWLRPWTSSSVPPSCSEKRHERLVHTLLAKLQARIGDEGLEDADRKEKNLQEIWKENEQRIEETTSEEGALSAALAAALQEGEESTTSSKSSNTKKRVFDM